jgi:hypothetical protein
MRRHLSVGLVAAALAMAGTAAASPFAASPAAASPFAAHPAAASSVARPAVTGREHFRLVSRAAGSVWLHAQATGVLAASGKALAGAIKSGRQTVTMDFPRGSVHLQTTRQHSSATAPNPTTCKFTETFTGPYTLRGGTHRYANATGSGTYVTTISGQLTLSDGRCTTQLASFLLITRTSGTMSW